MAGTRRDTDPESIPLSELRDYLSFQRLQELMSDSGGMIRLTAGREHQPVAVLMTFDAWARLRAEVDNKR